MTAPDPKILAEAIKRSEADMQLFRGIDDPEIKKLVEFCEVILVAAKAYRPMREALEIIHTAYEDQNLNHCDFRVLAGTAAAEALADEPRAVGHDWVPSRLGHGESMCSKCFITNREAAVLGCLNECGAALNPKDPSHE